jgi:hypothetical protein
MIDDLIVGEVKSLDALACLVLKYLPGKRSGPPSGAAVAGLPHERRRATTAP